MLKLFLALGASLVISGLALAQPTPPPNPGSTMQPGAGARDTNPSGPAKYREAQAAKISLVQAIEAAEGKAQGRAIEVDFEIENKIAQYEVKVLGPDGKLMAHHVDASSGQVIKSENHPVEGFFKRFKPSDVQAAKMSLKQAIATAEQKAGGKAVEAEVEREASVVQYEITVLVGNRTQKVKVHSDGQVAP